MGEQYEKIEEFAPRSLPDHYRLSRSRIFWGTKSSTGTKKHCSSADGRTYARYWWVHLWMDAKIRQIEMAKAPRTVNH
jgi:hypothetical protein